MTVEEACKTSGMARSEAEMILAHMLGKDRAWVIAHGGEPLTETLSRKIANAFAERTRGVPVAYITGSREFFGRNFFTDASVLIPRQSTEELIALTLEILRGDIADAQRDADTEIVVASHIIGDISEVGTIVDIGTGSGCIAITLALETHKRIIATDISVAALRTAQKNANAHGAGVEFLQGNVLEPVAHLCEPFFVVSNPPYIPEGTILSDEVACFEPSSALFAGKDGCAVLRSIVDGCNEHPYCRGFAVECREEQPSLCFPSEPEGSTL